MKLKKWLCMLLAWALLLCGCGLAEAAPVEPAAAADEAVWHMAEGNDGGMMFCDGDCAGAPINSMEDAAAVVEAEKNRLAPDEGVRFDPWRTLTDTAGNVYYVFRQMYGDTIMPFGAVKVVTDAQGNMLGLVGCTEHEIPEGAYTDEAVSAEAAAQAVLAQVPDAVLADVPCEQVLLPVNREADMDSEELKEYSRWVWVAYTVNNDAHRPYTAHYVTLGGEYLYALPVVAPGDEAARSGYDGSYVFTNMEPADYTGTVTLSDGSEKEISVTLMRDRDTGTYYLGNLERRIVVADCYEMLYNHGHVALECSPVNEDWDSTCLLSLYNYCRAWDFYHSLGWTGGDGLGTPIMVLKDFCDKEHNPQDNAAYAGYFYGWQMFLSSSANDLSQALDVLAHEFTHCFTSAAMINSPYKNDCGAINEAMSDIMGNICEMLAGDTEDTTWLLGENTSSAIRSMSDPHKYTQPEFTWDINYGGAVSNVTTLNDYGYVHFNSSLLNNVAYRLCVEGGMPLEAAARFWFAVDCAMVPDTDYPQLSLLLPWVLKHQGMAEYQPALEAAMDATALGVREIPETFPDDRALVTLELPDDEAYTDGWWALVVTSCDIRDAFQRVRDILESRGDCASALDELEDILLEMLPEEAEAAESAEDQTQGSDLERVIDAISKLRDQESAQLTGPGAAAKRKLADWIQKYLSDVFYYGMGDVGKDSHTIRMVARKGASLPILMRVQLEPSSTLVKELGLGVYFLGEWYNLTDVVGMLAGSKAGGEEAAADADADANLPDLSFLSGMLGADSAAQEADTQTVTQEDVTAMLDKIEDLVDGMSWIVNLLFYEIKGGGVSQIPSEGIEKITLIQDESVRYMLTEVQR